MIDNLCGWIKSLVISVYLKLMISALHYNPDFSFNNPEVEVLRNVAGKGENAGNQHLLLHPYNVF